MLDRCSFAVWQKIHDAATLQVAQDRSVPTALAPSPIVDAEDPGCDRDGQTLVSSKNPEQGRSMDEQTKLACQPRAGSSSQCHGNRVQRLAGAAGSSPIATYRLGQGLDEDALGTTIVCTEETSRPESDHDRDTFPWQIRNRTEITAVDPPGQRSAARAGHLLA
jgi:hypothetical protein